MRGWFRSLSPQQRTAGLAVTVVVAMGSLAWAAVPLYAVFCAVTGYGGAPGVSAQGADRVLDRTMTVRFDANTQQGMPWEFKPVQREMQVRIGETGLAFYEAYNPTDRPVAGQATYNVAPFVAGGHFTKIACFCFTEQVLQPGERVQMPVSFYVDPALVDDRDAKHVKHITLSYTFYETDLPKEQAMLDTPGDSSGIAVN